MTQEAFGSVSDRSHIGRRHHRRQSGETTDWQTLTDAHNRRRTRVVAEFHLSLPAPSSLSVALAISHAVLPKQAPLDRLQSEMIWAVKGLPQTIHVHKAKEFHGHALGRGCREHKIALKFRPPKTPHIGGHIKRLAGTLMGDIHLLKGTNFHL